MKIRSAKDFWAGIMFIGFGTVALAVAQMNYKMGTAQSMGPAYFPSVLGGILAILGLVVLFKSLGLTGPKVPRFHFRPLLFVFGACLAFAYLLRPLGLVVSIVTLVFISAVGGREFKWKEVTLLSVGLAALSVALFVKGLMLPFPIWPAFIK